MTAFNVAGLLHEPPGAVREARLRDHYVTLGPDVQLAGPLDADLRLQRTNRGILVRGELRAPLRRTCARCTDAYVEEVTVPISEEFVPSVDPLSGVRDFEALRDLARANGFTLHEDNAMPANNRLLVFARTS